MQRRGSPSAGSGRECRKCQFQASACDLRPPASDFCFAVCVAFRRQSIAADVTADFNAANKLYAEGKFAAAAATYEKILQSGAVSPALWFNYGNAEFKAGTTGPRHRRVSAGGIAGAA